MKYLKTFESISYWPKEGYEFMGDVFQDLSDDGYDVEVNRSDSGVNVNIVRNNHLRKRYEYFKLGDIIDKIEFAIRYLKEYYMDIQYIAIGSDIWNNPQLPLVVDEVRGKDRGFFISPWSMDRKVDGVRIGFSHPLRKIKESAHWKDDIISKLKFKREGEISDLFYDIIDVGYSHLKVEKIMTDIIFNRPGQKTEALEKNFYESYRVTLRNESLSWHNCHEETNLREFYQSMATLIDRMESSGYKYEIQNGSGVNISVHILHPDDKIDTSDIIKNIPKAKLKMKFGIDHAHELLSRHSRIMNIHRLSPKSLYITQKDPNYDLGRIYYIVNKMMDRGNKNKNYKAFSVVLDSTNSRVIVAE